MMHSHWREPTWLPVNQFRTVLNDIEARDNPLPTRAGGHSEKIVRGSGGRDRQTLKLGADGNRLMVVAMVMVLRVGTALTAALGTGPKRLVHDLANGPGATAALGAAAKAAIDLPRGARQIGSFSHSVAHVVVANDVA
jgi:hypothetical protein